MSWGFSLPLLTPLDGGGGGPDFTLEVSPAILAFAGQSVGLHLMDRLTVSPAVRAFSGRDVALEIQGGDLTLIVLPAVLAFSGQSVALTPSADLVLTVEPARIVFRGGQIPFRVTGIPQPAITTPLAVQRGILHACQIALAGMDVPVFDHVPHTMPFPFVAMDLHQVRDNDGSDVHGFIHDFYLSVWSDYRGQKQVWEILDKLWRGLHDKDLPLENGTHVGCRVTEQRSDRDADGLTYMGNLTARIFTNPFGDL